MGESAGFQGVGPLSLPERADSFQEDQICTLQQLNYTDYQRAVPNFLKFNLPGQPPLQGIEKTRGRPPTAAGETGNNGAHCPDGDGFTVHHGCDRPERRAAGKSLGRLP
jgi:hypothetical protein